MTSFVTPIIGVIACGGNSSRMGTDKSLLVYHEIPQRYFLYDLIKSICENAYLSCNEKQAIQIKNGYGFIIDKKEYNNFGPLSGLLSAFQEHPGKSILYIGCDYPFLTKINLENLIHHRDVKYSAVCYVNSDTNVYEPLLAIYEYSCHPELIKRFQEHKYSLREFLEQSKTLCIIPENNNFLRSIDTPSAYQSANRELKI